MPLTKVDYSKTIIYKIQHVDNPELLYVGSTTDFTRRKYSHKWRCNNTNSKEYNMKIYKMMRDNGGFDCFNINIIKDFPCNNKQEALIEEDRCMREMKANMNMIRAYTTPEERQAYYKHYYELNKEEIAERHKQYALEHKEEIAERHKQYRLEHIDKILEYNKLHKNKILEYQKQYRNQNKNELLEKKNYIIKKTKN